MHEDNNQLIHKKTAFPPAGENAATQTKQTIRRSSQTAFLSNRNGFVYYLITCYLFLFISLYNPHIRSSMLPA